MHSCVHNEQRFSWHIYLVNNSFWLDFFSNKPEICVISWSFLLLQISFFSQTLLYGPFIIFKLLPFYNPWWRHVYSDLCSLDYLIICFVLQQIQTTNLRCSVTRKEKIKWSGRKEEQNFCPNWDLTPKMLIGWGRELFPLNLVVALGKVTSNWKN